MFMDLKLMPQVEPVEPAVSQSSQHLMFPSHTQSCQSSAQISQMSMLVCVHKGQRLRRIAPINGWKKVPHRRASIWPDLGY